MGMRSEGSARFLRRTASIQRGFRIRSRKSESYSEKTLRLIDRSLVEVSVSASELIVEFSMPVSRRDLVL